MIGLLGNWEDEFDYLVYKAGAQRRNSAVSAWVGVLMPTLDKFDREAKLAWQLSK